MLLLQHYNYFRRILINLLIENISQYISVAVRVGDFPTENTGCGFVPRQACKKPCPTFTVWSTGVGSALGLQKALKSGSWFLCMRTVSEVRIGLIWVMRGGLGVILLVLFSFLCLHRPISLTVDLHIALCSCHNCKPILTISNMLLLWGRFRHFRWIVLFHSGRAPNVVSCIGSYLVS